ncbi:hypothetical protein [Naasia sp. SYSU D00948]|uniref:hypothetical protein n=1 Tax=Naasia sp. SYSU D00948 TaxID=2817379 RepID=UPI001B30124E|nr:hypothetical protein [Naasia sp. SYSU D00948]
MDDLERHSPGLDAAEHWERELITAAKDSLFDNTQEAAAHTLWRLASASAVPRGARVASALFATVATVEQDNHEFAIEQIRHLRDAIGASSGTGSGSGRLLEATLNLQLAVRLYELDRLNETLSELDSLERALARSNAPELEDFAVSDGISWKSRRVQQDIRGALRARGLALRARSESFEGESWVKVVRARPQWADVRIDWAESRRDREVVDETVESLSLWATRRIRFRSREPGIESGLESLLLSELGGDINEILRNRESLGKIRILRRERGAGDLFNAVESIRLLRQGRSKEGLDTAMELARGTWPVEALLRSTEAIIRRSSFLTRSNEFDIRVLKNATDLLTEDEANHAIQGLWNFLERANDDPLRPWSARQLALQTIGALIPAIEKSEQEPVAFRLLRYLKEDAGPHVIIVGAALSVTSQIDWGTVSSRTKSSWISWAADLRQDEELRDHGFSILVAIEPDVALRVFGPPGGDRLVAFLLDQSRARASVSKALMNDGVQSVLASLTKLREEARGSYRTFSGYDAGDLAAALAVKLNHGQLWEEIGDFLADTAVSTDAKARAMDRLSRDFEGLPETLLDRLRAAWGGIEKGTRSQSFLSEQKLPAFPEALRLGALLGTYSDAELLAGVMRLSGDSLQRARIEAARTVPFAMRATRVGEWGHAVLLQLSRDSHLGVRAESARALALTSTAPSALHQLVSHEVEELLASGTVSLPLSALHGFHSLLGAQSTADIGAHLVKVRDLSLAHPSRVVRKAAVRVLEAIGEGMVSA